MLLASDLGMHMRASTVRRITSSVHLPGRLLRKLISLLNEHIDYPSTPVVIQARGAGGLFEINNYREFIQQLIYFRGSYEVRETRLFKQLLRPGDTVVDIGANIGWFTLVASRQVSTNGKVISFEPSSTVYRQLQRTISLNNLTNVVTERLALSDENGIAVLEGTQHNAGEGSIVGWLTREDVSQAKEAVETMRFDTYYESQNLGHTKLLKIDVEGAEMKVLRGMERVLKAKACKYLLIEVDNEHLLEIGSSCAELVSFLRDLSYRIDLIGTWGNKPLGASEHISFANILAEAP